MTPREKLEHLALVLAVAQKLELTAVEVLTYSNALDLITEAQEDGENPHELAQDYVDAVERDPDGAIDDAQLVADMVQTIISVRGQLL